MTIIETPVFTKRLKRLLTEEEYRDLQNFLIGNPEAGKIIPQSGGLRKLRWAGSGRGKRGGSRLIYYWICKQETILMLLMYAKNVQEDLTQEQLKILRHLVEEELQ